METENSEKKMLQEKISSEYGTTLNCILQNCFENKYLNDEIINYIVDDIYSLHTKKDEKYLVLTSCRKYILQSIGSKKVEFNSIKHKELKELYGVNLNPFPERKLLVVLSLLSRKEFTYLINKYYFYDNVINNNKYDRKITDYFSGLRDAKGYFYVHGFKRIKIKSKDIYGCILYLPKYFFQQIGENGNLIPHSSIYEHCFAVSGINRYNISFGYAIIVAIIIIFGFIFYLFCGNF